MKTRKEVSFFALADTHGGPLPDFPSSAQFILHAGDVADGTKILKKTTSEPSSMRQSDRLNRNLLQDVAVPFYCVRGNHDIADPFGAFSDDHDVTGRVVRLAAGIWLAGIGWHGAWHVELPIETDLQHVCQQVDRQLQRLMMKGDKLILLTHYPPKTADVRSVEPYASETGIWYACIRDLVDRWRPAVVVEGHNHRWGGRSVFICYEDSAKTLVVNPGPTGIAVVIEADHRIARLIAPAGIA